VLETLDEGKAFAERDYELRKQGEPVIVRAG